MELVDLVGTDGATEEALEARQGPFLAKLATVESLTISLDREGCQALLERMDSKAKPGEPLAEMKALRSLHLSGSLKQWQELDAVVMRLFQALRPVALEEIAIIGVDQMKVVRTLLGHEGLLKSLQRLRVGLNGFHFLAQEDMLAMGGRLAKLRSFRLYGVSASGPPCKESVCRMFICAGAFLDYIGQIRAPEEVEVLHITNAGILGDDQQVASVLRGLACFGRLRVVKLPLPSLPLSLREVLSLRLALPRLLFFVAELERLEGADEYPEGEEWPPMSQIWPLCEIVTPLSVFTHEFPDHLVGPSQAVEEWARLTDAEQRYYNEVAPLVQQAYRHQERGLGRGGPPVEAPADTCGRAAGEAALTWRAQPAALEPAASECTVAGADGKARDSHKAATHGLQDWRAEERCTLRGVLQMKAADVCKDKARLRREPKQPKGNEGHELLPTSDTASVSTCPSGERIARAEEEDLDSSWEDAEELHTDRPQQCCPREQVGMELGDDSAAATEL